MTLTRRKLLGGISVLALTTAVPWAVMAATTSPVSRGQVCIGLFGPRYYGGFNPFLNWWKIASMPSVGLMTGAKADGKAAWAGGFLTTDTGELVNPVPANVRSLTRLFFASDASPGQFDFSGEEWIVKWDGAANCDVGGLTQGAQIISRAPGVVRFKMGSQPGNTWLTFTVAESNNPPRNIRVYQARYSANVDAGEKFNPDWTKQISQFGVLRFMDWMSINGSGITNFSQLADENYFAWCQELTTDSDYGPKGSIHPALICQLANLVRCNIHVCIPHQATDAFVTQFATYFRDNLAQDLVVTFEYSNECWNWGFPQTRYCYDRGAAAWPGGSFAKWYGFRAAQCMKIVSDVFGNRARWRGCIGTQTVWTAVTQDAIAGVQLAIDGMVPSTTMPPTNKQGNKQGKKWLTGQTQTSSSDQNSISVSSLFNEVSVTGYFGDVQGCVPLAGVTNSSPAVVTSPSHGFSNGTRLRLFVATGMTQLNNASVVVANATRDTFELSGVDSSNFGRFAVGNNYMIRAELFDLMDQSEAKFQADPSTYPSKYAYFNSVLVASWLTGMSGSIKTEVNVAALKNQYWPAQKAIADNYGLELRQYEGGLHFVGDGYLSGYGGNARFTEFLLAVGHSRATAEVYAQAYSAFTAIGGRSPAKFVEGGINSRYGVWAGLRVIPGDETNPVWQATLAANAAL